MTENITQRALPNVWHWERGYGFLTLEGLRALADRLGLTPGELVRGERRPFYDPEAKLP